MCILCDGEYDINSKVIYIFDCDNIVDVDILTNFPNLVTVNIDKCNRLESFPVLNNLKCLMITSCKNICCIPIMNSLQFLSCASCPSVVSIPEIPTLRTLICPETSVFYIPECFVDLRTLNITDCKNLETIPAIYKHVKILNLGSDPKDIKFS